MLERRGGPLGAALAVVLAAAVMGCGGGGLAPADAAARVGRQTILYGDFEEYVSTQVGLDAATSSVVLSGLFDQFLDEVLLRTMAIEQDVASAETPGWQVVEVLLEAAPPARVTEQEVVTYYRANLTRFSRSERLLLRQVLAESREAAQEIADLLRGGAAFDDLASRFLAAGVSASEGEITREDLPATFVERIFDLEPGEVSEVVAADYGFHVFQVVESMPAHEATLSEASAEIVDLLSRESHRRRLDELVSEARARYNVEVYARNLPFNYEGRYDPSET